MRSPGGLPPSSAISKRTQDAGTGSQEAKVPREMGWRSANGHTCLSDAGGGGGTSSSMKPGGIQASSNVITCVNRW